MNIDKLRSIAESIQIALLEKMAVSDISDFEIEVIPDDSKIEIYMVNIIPVKSIKVYLKIKRI